MWQANDQPLRAAAVLTAAACLVCAYLAHVWCNDRALWSLILWGMVCDSCLASTEQCSKCGCKGGCTGGTQGRGTARRLHFTPAAQRGNAAAAGTWIEIGRLVLAGPQQRTFPGLTFLLSISTT
jgi:hypothetical protein